VISMRKVYVVQLVNPFGRDWIIGVYYRYEDADRVRTFWSRKLHREFIVVEATLE